MKGKIRDSFIPPKRVEVEQCVETVPGIDATVCGVLQCFACLHGSMTFDADEGRSEWMEEIMEMQERESLTITPCAGQPLYQVCDIIYFIHKSFFEFEPCNVTL